MYCRYDNVQKKTNKNNSKQINKYICIYVCVCKCNTICCIKLKLQNGKNSAPPQSSGFLAFTLITFSLYIFTLPLCCSVLHKQAMFIIPDIFCFLSCSAPLRSQRHVAGMAGEESPLAGAVRCAPGDHREYPCHSHPFLHGHEGRPAHLTLKLMWREPGISDKEQDPPSISQHLTPVSDY